jgi:hypothetical protein
VARAPWSSCAWYSLSAVTTRNGVVLAAPWERIGPNGFAADDRMEQAATTTLAELTWWARALLAVRHDDPFVT